MLKTLPSSSFSLSDPAISPLIQAAPVEPLIPVVSEETDKTKDDSLFEHFAWLYIFCREKFFRDDTKRMIRALWPKRRPAAGERVIELGCGPGFYSCKLAERFREISVLGVDRSPSQLMWGP